MSVSITCRHCKTIFNVRPYMAHTARYCSRRCQREDWRDGHLARCCRTPRPSLSDATRAAFSAAESVGERLGIVDLTAAYQRRHRSKEMTE